VRDQIRKILEEYKEAVYTKLYPEREANFDYLPKTLIFAVSEAHAQLIVDIAKEVFGRTDDKFVQKITYSCGNTNELIKSFRYDVDFRIAVTVTLVATGTDVRPLEVLIFLNDVHSETLYAQMKGRGCRTISPSQLQSVTPNAVTKELFYLIDAVGVTESEKFVPSLDEKDERTLNPTLEALFEKMALGYLPDDYFQLLASKLSCLGHRADPEDLQEYDELSKTSPLEWAKIIMDVLEEGKLPPFTSASDDNHERMAVVHDLLTNIPARKKLVEIAKGYVKEVVGKTDTVISAGFSTEDAQASTQAFEAYVEAHRDDVEALRLIYNQETGKLTRAAIDDLERKLSLSIPGFRVGRLWNDYALLNPQQIKPLQSDQQAVTNLIQLVRYAYKQIESLYTLTSLAAQRFALWCGQAQRSITPEQRELFKKIAVYIAQNGSCDIRGLIQTMPEVAGSLIRFCQSADAANKELFTLNEFILKAA
jgi:type I restriction-modification system R subunit